MFKAITTMALDIKKEGNGGPHVGNYVGVSEKTTPMGLSKIWSFTDEDGLPFSIWGFTMLDRAMSGVKAGTLCRVTYRGMENVKTKRFGMKDVHQVMVEVDDGDHVAPVHEEENGSVPTGR